MKAKLPDVLLDGWAVFQALNERAKARTSAENVSDVLDAVARLERESEPGLTIEITPNQSRILAALAPDGKPESALQVLVAIAERGTMPGGSHERETVENYFGEEWKEKLRKSV